MLDRQLQFEPLEDRRMLADLDVGDPLIPSGVNAGQSFHLAFVTSTTQQAMSTNIADYNTIVQNLANSSSISGLENFTWTAIASTSAVDAKDNALVGGGAGTNNTRVFLLDDTKIADGFNSLWDGNNNRPAGTWTHLVVTVDTDTRTIQLYQDGVPGYTTIIGPGLNLGNINRAVPLHFGATEEGQPPFYTGTIDEVSIFNRVLTPGEAAAMAAISPQQPNTAPVVDAGPDLQVFTPADSIAIDATVTDDGIPTPASSPITVWTKVSGPGEVIFDDLASVDTTAHFSAVGTYVLRLTADDGLLSTFDELTVDFVAAPPPDFDGNGFVDGGDFLAWQRGYGSGTTFAEGDANGDLVVDAIDLSIWQNNFGSTVAAAATGSATTGAVTIGSVTSEIIDVPAGAAANVEELAAPSSASIFVADPLLFMQPNQARPARAGSALASSAFDSSSVTSIALESPLGSRHALHTKPHPQQALAGNIHRHLAHYMHDYRHEPLQQPSPDRLQDLDSDVPWSATVDEVFQDDSFRDDLE